MTAPTPNTPLSQDDVKLLRKGDWLLHESLGPCTVVAGGPAFLEVTFQARRQTSSAWTERHFTFLGRPDQSGWIPHDGGPNPAPGLRVVVKLRAGSEPCSGWANSLDWCRRDDESDITHWRPLDCAGETLGHAAAFWANVESPQPKEEVEAAGRVMRAISHTDYKLILSAPDYAGIQDCFVEFTGDLRTLLSALNASQAREARAVEFIRNQDCECDPPWNSRRCGRCEFIDNGEDGG